jgi:cellulose synthase/poly-beta-1,6-N-acetylglucosamine synthase-like glycosyltransferase
VVAAMKLLFWASLGVILYSYLFYAMLLLAISSLWQVLRDLKFGLTRMNRRRQRVSETPLVSFVFSAHNEEAIVADKLCNCRELEYPWERLEILVGCDGCLDRTAEIVRAALLPNLRLFEYHQRSGKPAILNRLVSEARGEIVVFSDANTMFAPGALRALVRHFAGSSIGCVCGELRLSARQGVPQTESAYWRYETFLKFLESRLNMMVGANGGIFAIRRELFVPLPDGAIIDDFLISMRIRAGGHRVIYDPEATADEGTSSIAQEFRRRVRIGAGNLDALKYTWRLLSPTAGLVSLAYWSHKICRWLVPFAVLGEFVAAMALARERLYAAIAVANAVLFLMAWTGYRLERRGVHSRVLSVPYYFVSLNLALLLGFVSYFFGRQTGVWNPTSRDLAVAAGEAEKCSPDAGPPSQLAGPPPRD